MCGAAGIQYGAARPTSARQSSLMHSCLGETVGELSVAVFGVRAACRASSQLDEVAARLPGDSYAWAGSECEPGELCEPRPPQLAERPTPSVDDVLSVIDPAASTESAGECDLWD